MEQLDAVRLVTHHLLFTVDVVTPILLDEQRGSALRGSIFQAVWKRFCTNKEAAICASCPLHITCPVSALVAPLREEHVRGRDIPRPYILLPPMEEKHRYEPGERMQFGITLFGSIIELLPYLLLSIKKLEEGGLGQRAAGGHGERGCFRVTTVETYNPLTGERHPIYSNEQPLPNVATLQVDAQAVQKRAAQLSPERITLTFLTPTRLVHKEHLLHRIAFAPLLHRLLERLMVVERTYGEQQSFSTEQMWQIVAQAERVRCVEDRTHWSDVKSYSQRLHRATPIGGLIGQATFAGDLAPFRELLVWGELIHIGKSCVKGNGWYRTESA